jgi:hypothetical protein
MHFLKYEHQVALIPAKINRTDGADKSILEVDLPPPQRNASQVRKLPNAR